MVPITIGLGLINLNAVVDTFFAARLIDRFHAVSAINAAFRLYMLPQGMFSVAVATVLFPSLARLAAAADFDGFRRTVDDGYPADRVPARAGERRVRRARRADRPRSSTSAATSRRHRRRPSPPRSRRSRSASPSTASCSCSTARSSACSRRGSRRWVALGEPRAQRGARRRVLLARDLGPAAGDLDREHRRRVGAVLAAAAATRPARPARHDALARSRDRRERRRARPSSCTASGGRSTTRSGLVRRGAVRARSRALAARRRRVPRLLPCAGSSRARGVAIVADAALRAADHRHGPRTASATSRSSRTSTMASRRSRTASSS